MKELMLSIFGAYVPAVDAAGVPVIGVAGLDVPWIFGVLCFCIVLWSFFSLLGVALKR